MLNWFVNTNEVKVENVSISDDSDTDTSTINRPRSTSKDSKDTVDQEIVKVNMDINDLLPTELRNELHNELLNEIEEFDKEELCKIWDTERNEPPRYYFYDLLDEIKEGIKLKHIEKVDKSSFLTRLNYTLNVIVLNNRLRLQGKDIGFSPTDQEYMNAFKILLHNEFRTRYRNTINISFSLLVMSGLALIYENNSFLTGVYVTNCLLIGSFLIRNFFD